MTTRSSSRRTFQAVMIAALAMGPWAFGCTDDSKPESPVKEIQNPDYSLTISLAKPKATAGEPIPLKFALKNTGVKDVRVILADALRIHEIEIVNQSNKQRVAISKRGEEIFKISREGSRAVQRLKPGEEVPLQIGNLAEIYELGSPGEYSISVNRQVPSQSDPKQTITISAPKVILTIVPKE